MSLLLVLATLLVAPATDDAIKLDLKSAKYKIGRASCRERV